MQAISEGLQRWVERVEIISSDNVISACSFRNGIQSNGVGETFELTVWSAPSRPLRIRLALSARAGAPQLEQRELTV